MHSCRLGTERLTAFSPEKSSGRQLRDHSVERDSRHSICAGEGSVYQLGMGSSAETAQSMALDPAENATITPGPASCGSSAREARDSGSPGESTNRVSKH